MKLLDSWLRTLLAKSNECLNVSLSVLNSLRITIKNFSSLQVGFLKYVKLAREAGSHEHILYIFYKNFNYTRHSSYRFNFVSSNTFDGFSWASLIGFSSQMVKLNQIYLFYIFKISIKIFYFISFCVHVSTNN